MVRVVAGVVMEEGRVMVTRRGPHVRLAGLWEFPGGKVEDGEDDHTALARELWEELQIRVEVGECVGENIHTEERGPFCLVAYRATIMEGRPVLSDHDEIAWITPDKLSQLDWAPADIPLLKKLV
ncbi:MAG: 8-oxo-dGTP diphosphatase MutT [Deltaproteobacteria bacterium]|nr:8-oxo-dGTP diphosphatase MutT [Deltaproteobacteria bacterium]